MPACKLCVHSRQTDDNRERRGGEVERARGEESDRRRGEEKGSGRGDESASVLAQVLRARKKQIESPCSERFLLLGTKALPFTARISTRHKSTERTGPIIDGDTRRNGLHLQLYNTAADEYRTYESMVDF